MRKGITHILAQANVYDEWFDEGAECVLIPIESYERARNYVGEMAKLNADGFDPACISEYDYSIIWLTDMPLIEEEFAKKIVVVDRNDMIDYDAEPHDGGVCGNEEDVRDLPEGYECITRGDMCNAYKESFSVTAHPKHTDVQMEAVIYYKELQDAPTLAEVLKKQEETS